MKLKSILAHFRATPEWTNLSPSSKRIFEQGLGYLPDFLEKDADAITRPDIMQYRNENYDKRGRCRIGLSVLSRLLSHGYDNGLCKYNHAKSIPNLPKKVGHKRWSLDEVKLVMEGASDAVRRAIMLALYTGQRRSDLINMKWSNYDGQYIHIIQIKTKKPLAIPIHPIMQAELIRMQRERDTPCEYILTSSGGWEWSRNGITMAVTRAARDAGIEGKSLHGIRKTTASLLAELGCTPHEIAAITGQSLKEVANYTREADQKVMAGRAVERWKNS